MTPSAFRPAHVVLFSGGTACRSINIALSRRGLRLTRIVPAWDSGGSSKVLRESFGMLPVGDIRQALMTMAHGEGHAGDVVKICNARLSDHGATGELKLEFDWFADGKHPLLQRMTPALRRQILNYLDLFRSMLPPDFDFRSGSIGNFILTGAYLANGRNINRAISVFRELCGIDGNVWPASTSDGIQLAARLCNGKELDRQHLITRLSGDDASAGIADIELLAGLGGDPIEANRAALDAIADADMIVFGPGSFYTSILPHLLVDGMCEALGARAGVPIVFIGNILECPETRGETLGRLVGVFQARLANGQGGPGLTHILANRELFPFEKRVGEFPYLKQGQLAAFAAAAGVEIIEGDFEDAWTRGVHDGEAVAEAVEVVMK